MGKYEIIIYWSKADKTFAAELPGCMAHANSQELVLKNAKDAINLWVKTAKEFDDPIPEPNREKFMLLWNQKERRKYVTNQYAERK